MAKRPATRPATSTSTRRPAERFRLSGPSITLDPRIHAVRRDIADIALSGRLFAPHYAVAERCRCVAAAAMLRGTPDPKGRAVSQLLHGEDFAVLDIAGGWAWGYALADHYVGYVAMAALGAPVEPTHRVTAPLALLFEAPDIKSPVLAEWPMGARFTATVEGDFLAAGQGYIHRRHARGIGEADADPVAVAERLLGAPYRWGGRGAGGIDCSGLVQLALGLAGIDAPRDSDMQRALGHEIAPDAPLARGDLIFFPGHVGLMADGTRLLHANAHAMAVTIEPLADVVARLATSCDQPIVARRRLK